MSRKKQAKTIIERFGFKDADLVSSEHDRLLLWLLNKKNCLKMLFDLNLLTKNECWTIHRSNPSQCDWDWDYAKCSANCMYLREQEQQKYAESIHSRFHEIHQKLSLLNRISVIYLDAEEAIMNGSWNIGFIDLKIEIYGRTERIKLGNKCEVSRCFYKPERSIFYVEIKPKINSIGEVIRQINFYRSHVKHAKWILVTNNNNYKEILLSQKIFTYKPKTN